MEPSCSSSSHLHLPSSARPSTHFSSTIPPSASTDQAHGSTETCLLSAQPFVKKYGWAVVGAFIAISGSMVLLACSSSGHSTTKQARRCTSAGSQRRGLAAQEIQRSRTLNVHSQGTNTETSDSAEVANVTIAQATDIRGKERVIEDADVCSAVPEVIIRDTSDSGITCVHALIDTDTIDRSAPLTIYSSLTCSASDTIRRPVSWSEPYIHKEEVETFTSYHSQALEEPLKPHIDMPTQRKSIPILGPSLSIPDHDATIPSDPHPSPSSKADCLPPMITRPSAFSSKFKETLDSYPYLALSWSQVRLDLFLLLSIFSFLFYYFYLKKGIQKHIEIQPVMPFPIFRMFP